MAAAQALLGAGRRGGRGVFGLEAEHQADRHHGQEHDHDQHGHQHKAIG